MCVICSKKTCLWLSFKLKLPLLLSLPFKLFPKFTPCSQDWHQREGAEQPACAQIRHTPLPSSQKNVASLLFSSIVLFFNIKTFLTEGTCLFLYPEKPNKALTITYCYGLGTRLHL